MPSGIYPHKPLSEETKRKIGLANAISNKGKHHTEEQKQKIRDKLKGRVFSKESKLKMSLAQKGIKRNSLSKEHKEKIGLATKLIKQENIKSLVERGKIYWREIKV